MKQSKVYTEMFSGLPKMVDLFTRLDRNILYFNCYRWEENTTKEALSAKKDALLETLQGLQGSDLIILYYIKHLDGLWKSKTLEALQNWYRAECAGKNLLYHTDRYNDPLDVGRILGIKTNK